MNPRLWRSVSLPPIIFLVLPYSLLGQSGQPSASRSVTVNQATVAFTPGQAALNTLKDALREAHSTVDVAMFRFTHPALIDALCYLSAVKNVKVRVFLDQENQRLEDGADFEADGETVAPVESSYASIYQKLIRNGVQVYAARGESKMHLRCAVVDAQTVLTGSCNWIPQSFKQKYDDVLVLRSPDLARAYTNKIEALLPLSEPLTATGPSLRPDVFIFPSDHEDPVRKEGSKRESLQPPMTIDKPFAASVYFSPEGAGLDALLNQIGHATRSVDLAMRWATDPKFDQQVAAARKVPVRLLVNRDMFEHGLAASMQPLLAGGVKVYVSKPKLHMHWKVAVIDGRWLWTGSANATTRADGKDQEDMICADSPELARCYESAYETLASRLAAPPPQ